MNKINILFVGMSNNLGGIETYLINVFRKIDKNKFNVYFLSVGNTICFEKEIVDNGGSILYVSSRKENYFRFLKELTKQLNSIKFDIIEFELMNYSLFEPILKASKLSNTKIILHTHIAGTDLNCNKALNHIGKSLTKKGDFIRVACSKAAGELMFPGKEYTIFNNAININQFFYNEVNRNVVRRELNVVDKFVVGHVGRFDEVKNHKYLINVFEKVVSINNDSSLLLVGTGILEKEIRNMVEEKGLTDKVIFLGNTNEVAKYYHAMDVFLFPSKHEGLGIVLVEAQTSNLPCIVSNAVPNEVKILDTTISLSLDESYDKWAEAVVSMKNVKRSNIVSDIIKDNFEIGNEIKSIEEFYIKILGGK